MPGNTPGWNSGVLNSGLPGAMPTTAGARSLEASLVADSATEVFDCSRRFSPTVREQALERCRQCYHLVEKDKRGGVIDHRSQQLRTNTIPEGSHAAARVEGRRGADEGVAAAAVD